jgi:DNA-binding MarR family transcriptional regulator
VTALPLSTLISQALVALTIELDNEFEHRFLASRGGARVVSLTMWSNLLRFVGDGISVGQLVSRIGLPPPTSRSRIGGVERWGYVTVDTAAPNAGSRSSRHRRETSVVVPTPAGRRAAAIWPSLPAEVDERWRQRFGTAAVDELRRTLHAVVDGIDVALPQYLPIVSSADGLRLVPGQSRSEPAPGLPLTFLMARALMAYTLEFEAGSALSLPLSADVLRVIDGDGVPVRELPERAGISKAAVEVSLTSLRRTEFVVVDGSPASKRMIRTTPAGDAQQREQGRLHAEIERHWNARIGASTVESLRDELERILGHPKLSEGLRPYPDGWRANKPDLHLTQALLADPRRRLPHYPMVLHRGGWPDGS